MDQSTDKFAEFSQPQSFLAQALGSSTAATMSSQFQQNSSSETSSDPVVPLPLDATLAMAGLSNVTNPEGTWLTSLPQNVTLDNLMTQTLMPLGLPIQNPIAQESQTPADAWNPAWTNTAWFTSTSTVNSAFENTINTNTTSEQSVPAQDTNLGPLSQWATGGWTMPTTNQVGNPLGSTAQLDTSTLGVGMLGGFQLQEIRLPQLDTIEGITSAPHPRTRRRKADSSAPNGQPPAQRVCRRTGLTSKRSQSFSENSQSTGNVLLAPVSTQVASMSAPTSPNEIGLVIGSLSSASPSASQMPLATIQTTGTNQGTNVGMFPSYNSQGEMKQCKNCFCINTPSWRRSILDKTLLCNACGLYEKNYKTRRPWEKDREGVLRVIRNTRSRRGTKAKLPRRKIPQQSSVEITSSVEATLTANTEASTSTNNIVPAPIPTNAVPLASSLTMEGPPFLQCSSCHKIGSAPQFMAVNGQELMVLCAECLAMLTVQGQP